MPLRLVYPPLYPSDVYYLQAVDEANSHGTPSLIYAVRLGNVDACRRLLEVGANPNVKESRDTAKSSLHYALEQEQKDIFQLLTS